MPLRIGLDFDNTLAGYDAVFAAAAQELKLVESEFSGTKHDVRTLCRSMVDGERIWMRLQGKAYGALMHRACLITGADQFLTKCREWKASVFIVSHKTEYGHFDEERINLREAALSWMTEKGFFDPDKFGISPENVFFENDRVSKVRRIASLNCQFFVDDLQEVFQEPDFPARTRRLLFADGRVVESGPYEQLSTWRAITEAVFVH